MARHLHCVIVDAGPATYMKPVLARWIAEPPGFEWSLRLGEKARAALAGLRGLAAHLGPDIDRGNGGDDGTDIASGADALLISAGGWPAENAHVSAAQRAGRPVLQFLDTCYNYARRLCRDGLWTLPDRLFMVTRASVAEAAAEGVPEALCTVVGHPSWEEVRVLPPAEGADVLFVGAPVTRHYGRRLGYTEDDAWNMLCDALARNAGWHGRVCYAAHPEQDAMPPDVTRIDYSVAALARFDTVAGMFSAPLVDAFLAGRRCLSLQPGATDTDMFFLSRQGFLPRFTDGDALAGSLSVSPPDPAAFAREMRGSFARLQRAVTGALAA